MYITCAIDVHELLTIYNNQFFVVVVVADITSGQSR